MKHWLNLSQRPVQGRTPIGRFEVFNYRHKLSSIGWHEAASFKMRLDYADMQWAFDTWLGGQAEIYVDNPVLPIFEGYVNRLTYNMGTYSHTISLDQVANRVSAVYAAPDVSGTMVQQTPQVDVAESQAVYGIKEGNLEGLIIEGTNVGVFTALVNTQALIMAFPHPSTSYSIDPNDIGTVTVELKGWHDTLNWYKYNNTATTITNPQALIGEYLAANPNPSVFVAAAQIDIQNHAGFSKSVEVRTGITGWQAIQSLQEAGDGSNAWVAGLTPRVYGYNRLPVLYYRQASTTPKYLIRARSTKVCDVYGAVVPPYEVVPDCGVIVGDLLQFAVYGPSQNPNEFYVDAVEYDGDSQQVRFVSTDNTGAEGIYEYNRYYKRIGRKLGAGLRTAYV
jgi:hypothetical protein